MFSSLSSLYEQAGQATNGYVFPVLKSLALIVFMQRIYTAYTKAQARKHLDYVHARRCADYSNKTPVPPHVLHTESTVRNKRDKELWVQEFQCKNIEPKAIVVLCHGYGDSLHWTMFDTALALTEAGFNVHGLDYEGHGKSEGLFVHIEDFDAIVDDVAEHILRVKKSRPNLPIYVVGISMGGGVAICLSRKYPALLQGCVFVVPMCKIHEDMMPHPLVMRCLRLLAAVFPTANLVPSTDMTDICFNTEKHRQRALNNPLRFGRNPRLHTAMTLLDASMEIEANLHQVTVPFFVLHGSDDAVTCPSTSQALFDRATSTDKAIKIYPGERHCLLAEHPAACQDICDWITGKSEAWAAAQ